VQQLVTNKPRYQPPNAAADEMSLGDSEKGFTLCGVLPI
jgi:hypothetical protein